jgi:LPS export ABC transporter protein LptC
LVAEKGRGKMIKKVIFGIIIFVALYVGLIQLQIVIIEKKIKPVETVSEDNAPSTHKVYSFAFSKYTPDGKKEIEIEGDSADIFSNTVDLLNVVAKAYAEEVPVTITADSGNYNKPENRVHLEENVVATTADGARLLTEKLDIHPADRVMETDVAVQVKKENINIAGEGARGDSQLKKVKFKKNVTVVIQNTDKSSNGGGGSNPTVITCDGPLLIDYVKNIAHFEDNVIAKDERGKLSADKMDVYYNRINRRVSKIVALGNVVIENPDGNQTFSDSVIYLAEEGRVILGGDTEALYYENSDQSNGEREFF